MAIVNGVLEASGLPVIELYVTVNSDARTARRDEGRAHLLPRLVRALVDTRARTTFVLKSVIDDLELDSEGESQVHSATSARGPLTAPAYSIDLDLAGDITGSVAPSLWVTGAQDLSAFGVEALLGWDVMRLWRLEFDGSAGTFCLTLP